MSRPNAQVKWYKNRKELLPCKKYQLISQDIYRQLTIEDVRSSDEDTYTCDAGDDKTSCQLLVEGEGGGILAVRENRIRNSVRSISFTKNVQLLQSSFKYRIMNSSSYICVSFLKRHKSGSASCVVTLICVIVVAMQSRPSA